MPMTRRHKFALVFAQETIDHLDTIECKYHSLIEKTLDEQLSHTPEHETRNRKSLESPAPFGATWELRFGPHNRFRVFYEVDLAEQIVHVLAIGVKKRNILLIGGEEFTQ